MSSYKIDRDDKRIIFTLLGSMCVFALFFAGLAAIHDKSWSPIIIGLMVTGVLLGTLVFFYLAIRALWALAKRIFPDE